MIESLLRAGSTINEYGHQKPVTFIAWRLNRILIILVLVYLHSVSSLLALVTLLFDGCRCLASRSTIIEVKNTSFQRRHRFAPWLIVSFLSYAFEIAVGKQAKPKRSVLNSRWPPFFLYCWFGVNHRKRNIRSKAKPSEHFVLLVVSGKDFLRIFQFHSASPCPVEGGRRLKIDERKKVFCILLS